MRLREWWSSLKSLWLKPREEADMSAEIRFHLAMETEKLQASGLSGAEARREALKRFGGVDRFGEEVRDERGVRRMEELMQDLRYGVRVLRRNPGVAALMITTLALGIGAATAVFSIVNTVLLNPLPYPDSDRLVIMREIERDGRPNWAAHPNFVDWREQATRSFESMTSVEWPEYVTVLGGTEPVRVMAMGVSREYFDVAGVPPFLGRTISTDENRAGGAATVVVSRGFWEQYLGAPRNLAGLTIDLNGEAFQVVGVMPAGFTFMGDVGVWYPYERNPNPNRMSHAYRIVGRLRQGVTIVAARAEMTALSQLLLDEYQAGTRAVDVYVNALHDEAVSGVRASLLLLLGAAALLLLVACTNIASALLARGMVREQEIAVRASMGAGRARLVRQLFTESLTVAVGGVALGILLAFGAVRLFAAMGAGRVPRMGEVSMSPGVLLFSVALSFAAAVLFGLMPAIRLTERDVSAQLRSGGSRGSTSGGNEALWRALVGAEIAMATMLLIGAGLLVKSLWTILDVDVGYQSRGVITADVSLPPSTYSEPERSRLFYERLLPELAALNGVTNVGLANKLPLQYGSWTANTATQSPDGSDGDGDGAGNRIVAGWRIVNGAYFDALSIPVIRGRTFTDRDVDGAETVAIVNAPLAARLWPGEDPIGRRVRNGYDPRGEWLTVVGVSGHARSWQADEQLEIYVHYLQRPEQTGSMTALLATREAADGVGDLVRLRIRELDPNVPVEIGSLAYMVNRSVAGQRFTMLVLVAFAVTALILAVIGVYGVVAYSVARRRREIGIRMALGARPGAVRRLIQRGALSTAMLGVLAGCGGALALQRVVRSMLYQVQPTDPWTFGGAVGVLLAAALVASYVPARRSTAVDPMITMRAE